VVVYTKKWAFSGQMGSCFKFVIAGSLFDYYIDVYVYRKCTCTVYVNEHVHVQYMLMYMYMYMYSTCKVLVAIGPPVS
jgi:hypothetical protein